MAATWKNDWNTGIEMIDLQHQRILEYINKLGNMLPTCNAQPTSDHGHEADEYAHYCSLFESLSTAEFGFVLDQLIAYVEAHFNFEENLHLDSKYELAVPHKETHDLFIKRLQKYREKYSHGEDVADKLYRVLEKWIEQHIQYDMDYAATVKHPPTTLIAHEQVFEKKYPRNWFTRTLSAFSKDLTQD
ncbi:MAG: hemerythrin domain-containing protein [Gallionella sp.]